MPERTLFTAIRVPEPIGAEIAARVRAALGADDAFRLPHNDAFHLTLLFHGRVDGGRAAGLADALADALREARGLSLELGPTGAFPRRGAERVLWVGVEGGGGGAALERLRSAVLSGAETAGSDTARERSRPFQPHVSVARPRLRRRPNVAQAFYELDFQIRFPVAELVLQASVPVPGDRNRYEVVRSFALAPPVEKRGGVSDSAQP